jgi:hypothetical protein
MRFGRLAGGRLGAPGFGPGGIGSLVGVDDGPYQHGHYYSE